MGQSQELSESDIVHVASACPVCRPYLEWGALLVSEETNDSLSDIVLSSVLRRTG